MAGLTAIASHTGSRVVYQSFRAYSDKLRAWDKQRQREITNGARAGLRLAHRDAMRRFASHGIGRRIWGQEITGKGGVRKRSNLPTFIKLGRVRWFGSRLTATLSAKGIPALVDKGGRTKRHRIKGGVTEAGRQGIIRLRQAGIRARMSEGKRKPMAFQVGGRTVFSHVVNHPGSKFTARPFLEPALRAHERIIVEKIDERLRRSLAAHKVA